jgi:drug/metabolite transporter (DMT)-like permease
VLNSAEYRKVVLKRGCPSLDTAAVLPLVIAFGASVAWGSADFLAGVSCRRLALLTVLLVSQAVGLALLLPVVLVQGRPAAGSFVLLAVLAGVFNGAALAALYRGLAGGKMGVVAPIAATDAVIPVAFGLLTGERPAPVVMVGIGLALAGIVLASRPAAEEQDDAANPRDSTAKSVTLALIAALCFGGFMIAINGASEGGTLWAVTFSRLTTVVMLAAVALALRPNVALGRRDAAPLLAIGALDAGACVLFAAATTAGLLSLVAVFGSFYPVFTILLAGAVLRERLDPKQRVGVLGALVGATLIAAG